MKFTSGVTLAYLLTALSCAGTHEDQQSSAPDACGSGCASPQADGGAEGSPDAAEDDLDNERDDNSMDAAIGGPGDASADGSSDQPIDASTGPADATVDSTSQIPTSPLFITEIGWMGSPSSDGDRFLEIFNTHNTSARLSDYALFIDMTEVSLPDTDIGPDSALILEIHAEATSLEPPAAVVIPDLALLGSTGASIRLCARTALGFDACDLVEQSDGWQAGDATTRQTMVRVGSLAIDTTPEFATYFGLSTAFDSGGAPIHGSPGEHGAGEPPDVIAELDLAGLELLTAELDVGIDASDATIVRLEAEIAKLEDDNSAKAAEAAALVSAIERRRDDVEEDYEDAQTLAIICAFSGNCPPILQYATLSEALDADDRLTELNRDLAAARADQARIQQEIATYEAYRDAVRDRLELLRHQRDALDDLLQNPVSWPETIPGLIIYPEARELSIRAQLLSQVQNNLLEQIRLLQDLRDEAADLNATLVDILASLEDVHAHADAVAQESRRALTRMIKLLTSGDLDSAAQRWLDSRIAGYTRQILSTFDVELRPFVEALLTGEEPDIEALRDDLIEALLTDLTRQTISRDFAPELPLAIPDLDFAFLLHEVEATGTLTAATLSLRIDHTFVGDLQVAVELDGVYSVVSNREGGAGDVIEGSYDLHEFIGFGVTGTWVVLIIDSQELDVGQVTAASLELEYTPGF